MKRNAVMRGLLGCVLGIVISTVISLIISACIGDGSYYAVVPSLIEECGSEFNAVLVQMLFSVLYGAAWGSASVIWDMERWSLMRQTVTHLAITSTATFPVAYFTHWMEHSIGGILKYFGIFLATYFMIWLCQYLPMRKRIARMNEKLKESGMDAE